MEIKRSIHLLEKEQKENMVLKVENNSEVRPIAVHMPTFTLCKRIP